MGEELYRFKCEQCSHEYVADEETYRCPECSQVNEASGSYEPEDED